MLEVLTLIGIAVAVMRFMRWTPLALIDINRNWRQCWRETLGNRRKGDDRRQNDVRVDFDRRTRVDRRGPLVA
jgi:hypothetical protein